MHAFESPLARNTIVVSWLFVGLACISMAFIILWCIKYRRAFGLPDGLVLVAFVVGVLLVSLVTWAICDEGGGRHQSDLSPHMVAALAKSLIVNEALWSLVGALMRISACCTLYDMNWVPQRHRLASMTILGLSVAHGIGSILEVFLVCRPLASQWDANVNGACGNQMLSFLAIELMGMVLDVSVIVQSTRAFDSVSLSWSKKLWPLLMLNLGALVLVITCLRLKSLHLSDSPDFTYSKSYLGLLSCIGCMLSVIFCAAIAVRGCIRKIREHKYVQGRVQRLGSRDFLPSDEDLLRAITHEDLVFTVFPSNESSHNAPSVPDQDPRLWSSSVESILQINEVGGPLENASPKAPPPTSLENPVQLNRSQTI